MLRLFVISLAFLATSLTAAPVEHMINVEPRSCQIGDHIEIEVTLITDEGVELGRVQMGELGSDVSRVGNEEISPAEQLSDGRSRRIWRATLAPFVAGNLTLPALTVPWTTDNSASGELDVDLGTVTVASVIPEGLTFPGPKAPHGPFLMEEERPLWPWMTGLGGLAGVLIALWLWRRLRRTGQPEVVRRAPARPPHEVALEELQALEPLLDDLANTHRALFYGLTDIVRVYFEGEFKIGAPEMTSAELNTALADAKFPAEICEQMRHWTAACDLVKYASQRPRPEHGRTAITLARSIVTTAHQHALIQRAAAEPTANARAA